MYKNIDLDWSADKLYKILQNEKEPWIYEQNVQNRYCRSKDPYIWHNLYDQIMEQGYMPKGCGFAEMKPYTSIDIHKDYGRHSGINFPIIGDWDKSPVTLYNDDKIKKGTYYYKEGQAVLLNTQNYHKVDNNSDKTRYILSISVIKEGDIYHDVNGKIVQVSDKYIRELQEFHKSNRNN